MSDQGIVEPICSSKAILPVSLIDFLEASEDEDGNSDVEEVNTDSEDEEFDVEIIFTSDEEFD